MTALVSRDRAGDRIVLKLRPPDGGPLNKGAVHNADTLWADIK
jgi:hypothetical protein